MHRLDQGRDTVRMLIRLAVVGLLVVTTIVAALEAISRTLILRTASTESVSTRVPAAERNGNAFLRSAVLKDPTLEEDDGLLWRNRAGFERTLARIPSAPDRSTVWTQRTDARGFRLHAHGTTTAGKPRYSVLCVGDSVTFGFNVDQEEDYPAVLERLMHERFPGIEWEVINAGVSDWTWVQGAAFLLDEGFALRPDLIVIAHGVSDALRVSVTDSEELWLNQQTAAGGDAITRLGRNSGAWRLLSSWLEPPAPQGPSRSSPGCRLQEAGGSECRRVSPPEIRAVAQQVGAAVKAVGADLLLVNLDFARSGSGAAVKAAAIRDDLRYLDHVSLVVAAELQAANVRARDLGLALPSVPLVPLGRIGMPATEGRGARMRFRVQDVPVQGSIRIRGHGPERSGFQFDQLMNDDGAEGDEAAGDGVYSTVVEAPPAVSRIRYRFHADDVAELEAPPGMSSSHVDRTIEFNRDGSAAIARFGVLPGMADAVHPDADGHTLIARHVLKEIEKTKSFRRATAQVSATAPGNGMLPGGSYATDAVPVDAGR